uniref:Uncharacterized protein n=1 Tax=Timema shepardi TaxID=629360 RepID=A0A7R9AUJ7_TIMSH|nr:unnamed protein product [Timema shepardi]
MDTRLDASHPKDYYYCYDLGIHFIMALTRLPSKGKGAKKILGDGPHPTLRNLNGGQLRRQVISQMTCDQWLNTFS